MESTLIRIFGHQKKKGFSQKEASDARAYLLQK
jgi:hypothetical protein